MQDYLKKWQGLEMIDLINLVADPSITISLFWSHKLFFVGIVVACSVLGFVASIYKAISRNGTINWNEIALTNLTLFVALVIHIAFFAFSINICGKISSVFNPDDFYVQMSETFSSLEIENENLSNFVEAWKEGTINNEFSFAKSVFKMINTIFSAPMFLIYGLIGIIGKLIWGWFLLQRAWILLQKLILAPIHIAKCAIPSFGIQHLIQQSIEVFQVSFWLVYFAVYNYLVIYFREAFFDPEMAFYHGYIVVLYIFYYTRILSIPQTARADFTSAGTTLEKAPDLTRFAKRFLPNFK